MVSIFVYQKVQILPLLLQKIVLSRIPLIQNNVKLAKRITRWIQLVNAQSVQRVILRTAYKNAYLLLNQDAQK